jgi:ribosomal protein S18 acetylase RimI-like enzyme
VIRRATLDDASVVALLFRRSFGTLTFLPTLHTPEEDRAYFERVLTEWELWVHELDGTIHGFDGLNGAELTHLYVEPGSFRRGIGTALFDDARQRRPDGLWFWVFQRNEGARRFYERHGCRLVELGDGSGNEEREPDARYEWVPRPMGQTRGVQPPGV